MNKQQLDLGGQFRKAVANYLQTENLSFTNSIPLGNANHLIATLYNTYLTIRNHSYSFIKIPQISTCSHIEYRHKWSQEVAVRLQISCKLTSPLFGVVPRFLLAYLSGLISKTLSLLRLTQLNKITSRGFCGAS